MMVLPDRKSFSVDNNAALGYSEVGQATAWLGDRRNWHRAEWAATSAPSSEPWLAADLSVRRINPNKLRQFARARGVLAKN